ncbi:gliding motility protein [Flavobacterium akiainvivens]|uniref:Gliding motility protein n=1 Tax=Flavobacterium akiainvivens TaxID=1202724 RepID=A0A0M9VIW8_9FLAO|nr:tetratricopeptide repeat protein [Flavobacterium akiainvivens]KOS07110.1 gliding motility protein [Flavobacterium akiainvivens]SFQ75726.1 protein involved in gliding motility SprE [Flavobacterium akiainvivens]
MKTSTCKYFLLIGAAGLILACSTKKDTFINRNFHAVNTEYNVLYNGNLALTAGIEDLKTSYVDNYWDVLSVERMQPTLEQQQPTDKPNANFQRAEEKAVKAIQKHSMNIGNSERNPQMDEAHLLLGKARYYDNRYIPALEALNYILLKYPNSSQIDEAKVWREKVNIRIDNDGVAIKNLNKLIKEKGEAMEPQIFSDANAMLAQAYIKEEKIDSAAYLLKKAVIYTKDKEKKARYRFIVGQLHEKLKEPDSAFAYFQKVIDMKRQSPRIYIIQAHARQAAQFDYKKGDTLAFMEKYRKLLKDRENRPYLDWLNYQVAVFYDKQDLDSTAVVYYNKSLRAKPKDRYLNATNYRSIGEINFENAQYVAAGKYYDSTLVHLDDRTREYKAIKKKRDNLADVIKYEAIAQVNDSILHITSLNEQGRLAYYEDYIKKLKVQDELKRKRAEAEAQKQANIAANQNNVMGGNDALGLEGGLKGGLQTTGAMPAVKSNMPGARGVTQPGSSTTTTTGTDAGAGGGVSNFQFYNTSAVAYGQMEFKKRWGGRALVDNWRWSSELRGAAQDNDDAIADADSLGNSKDEVLDPRYDPNFYITQLPTEQVILDSLAKERNFAYYQLGIIYKEKFKEYRRSVDKLERLLVNNPEERLILPAKYNLYKVYEILGDAANAEKYKNQVLNEYPDSRYAQMIRNPQSEDIYKGSPEAVYAGVYKMYEDGKIREAAAQTDVYIDTYTGEEINSKFELLKAQLTGRLQGIEEYKKQLNYVALTYPNSEEGKRAEEWLKTQIPLLEKINFGQEALSYKLVFKFAPGDPRIAPLTAKLEKFIKEGVNNYIKLTTDIYTTNEDFIVVHGFISKLAAEDAATVLTDYKEYKIGETPTIISTEDYKVVMIRKNFNQYLSTYKIE